MSNIQQNDDYDRPELSEDDVDNHLSRQFQICEYLRTNNVTNTTQIGDYLSVNEVRRHVATCADYKHPAIKES